MHALLPLALLSVALPGPRLLAELSPVEHDDQGRVDEPDFQATSVFGPWLGGRNLDRDLDAWGEPDDFWMERGWGFAAPGCMEGAQRRPSGTCALGLAGGGWASPYAPRGALGLLDLQVQWQPGAYLEVNRKLDDARLRPPHLGWASGRSMVGPVGLLAWFGVWGDANRNGVIDDAPGGEFAWRGRCQGCTPGQLKLAVWPWGAPEPLGGIALAAESGWSPMDDRTPAQAPGARGWFAAQGLPALGYDASLLHTTVLAAAEIGAWGPEDAPFLDVDRVHSVSPSLDETVGAALESAPDPPWTLARFPLPRSPSAGRGEAAP